MISGIHNLIQNYSPKTRKESELTYAFVRIREPVANGRRHGILSCLRRVVIDKGYPLPVLVLRQTNLMEAIELGKYLLELLLRNILRYVANVEGKHLLGSFRSDCS